LSPCTSQPSDVQAGQEVRAARMAAMLRGSGRISAPNALFAAGKADGNSGKPCQNRGTRSGPPALVPEGSGRAERMIPVDGGCTAR